MVSAPSVEERLAVAARDDTGDALITAGSVERAGRSYVVCAPARSRLRRDALGDRSRATAPPMTPFAALAADGPDELACDGRLVAVPPDRYDWIHLRVARPVAGAHEVWLHYADAVDPEILHLTGSAEHSESARVPVPRLAPLVALRLPRLPGAALAAVTLARHIDAPVRDAAEPTLSATPGAACRVVDLSPYVDCVGMEPAARPGTGAFNIWSNTFPLEELPLGGTIATVGGIPFRFPVADGSRPDNIRCRGQRVALPGVPADWLYVLGAAERRTEDMVLVHGADGTTRSQWLRMSDFWPETESRLGDVLAFRTSSMLYPRHVDSRMSPSLWRQRVPVAVRCELDAVTLPDNPAMHVLALTVVDEEATAR